MENTHPNITKFFENSKISFSDAILNQVICNSRKNLPWDCGLFLLAIFNVFVGIIEVLVRSIIFLLTLIPALKLKKDDALYYLTFTAGSIYFSLKFVGMSLFNSKLDYNTLHINDPVQEFMTSQSFLKDERQTRKQ